MHPHASRRSASQCYAPGVSRQRFRALPAGAARSVVLPHAQECARTVPEPCTPAPRASGVRTASTVCMKNPRPRSLPMCPTPLMDVDDRTDRCHRVSCTKSTTGEAFAWSLVWCRCGCIKAAKDTSGSICATATRLWSLSRSAFEQAANPKDSLPCGWPLEPYVSFDAYRAVGRPQRFARPSSWGPTLLVYSSCIVSLGNMWVRIRPRSRG